MKTLLTIIFLLFFILLNLKSQEIQPDWVSFDLDKYVSMYWMDNNREEVIELVGSNNNMAEMNNFELHFFNLKTQKLIKKVPANTNIVSSSMELNTDNSMFYLKFRDTVYFLNKDDFSFKDKLPLPFTSSQSNSFKYNYKSKNYNLYSKRTNELILVRFNSTDYSLIKFDTLKIDTTDNYSLRISDNGNYFALKSSDHDILVYETETLKLIRKIQSNHSINQFHVSDDGAWLAVFTNFITDESCLLYNLADEKLDFFVSNHLYGVPFRIKFSANGNYFLLSYDSYTYIYNLKTKELIRKINPPNSFYSADFCLNDTKIIDISRSRVLVLNDIITDTFVNVSDFSKFGKIFNLNTVRIKDNGDIYYISGDEGTISVRNINDASIKDEISLGGNSIYILNRKIKDTMVAFSYTDYKLNLIDTKTNKIFDTINLKGIVKFSGSISSNLQWYASTSTNSKIFLCNLNDYKSENKKYLLNSELNVTNLAFSSDSKMLAVGLKGNFVKIYKIDELEENTEPYLTLNYPSTLSDGSIYYLKFIDGNTKLVTSTSGYNKFLVWDLEDEEIIYEPISPVEHFENGEFPAIKYIEYREKFNDYFTTDAWGNIIFWDKNFKFKNFIKVGKYLALDVAISFDYNQKNNDFLIGCSYSTMAKINFDFITNVVETNDNISDFSISPNPASDYIEISIPENMYSNPTLKHVVDGVVETGQVKVQIFNTLGIEMINEAIHPMTSSHRMNIENLPDGVYFIKIGDRVERFVKI
jgi:WD40 repeat protein